CFFALRRRPSVSQLFPYTTLFRSNTSNLVIANVTDPTAMTVLSTLTIPGTVRGIDVDTVRKLAVVASGANVYVVDIANLAAPALDRKSTRLNSSHDQISYAVFGLK